MKYFIFHYPSKKTSHPDGDKIVEICEKGTTKTKAQALANEILAKIEGDNAQHFKLPKPELIDHEAFEPLYAEQQALLDPPAEEQTKICVFDNHDENLGLRVEDLELYTALVVLHGKLHEYTDQQIKETESFIAELANEDAGDRQSYLVLFDMVKQYMPVLFDKVTGKDLLEFIAHVDHTYLISKGDYDRATNAAIAYITDNLGIEYGEEKTQFSDEEIEQIQKDSFLADEPEDQADIEDLDDFTFDALPEPEPEPPKCTFADDLADLNQKLAILDLGQSLVIDDLSNELYHACDGYSNSTLKTIGYDPSLVEWQKCAPVDDSKVNNLSIGDAVHTRLLEPEQYKSRYAIAPDVNKRTNEGKQKLSDFESENQNRVIISAEDNRMIDFMARSALSHPVAKQLLQHETGKPEMSVFWRDPETGILFKIRVDWICIVNGQHIIMDVKSCGDVWQFEKTVADFDYHQQDAFYSMVYQQVFGVEPVFSFLAISKTPQLGRYPVRLVVLDGYDKEIGRNLADQRINTLSECKQSGIWGGFETITRPQWAKKNDYL